MTLGPGFNLTIRLSSSLTQIQNELNRLSHFQPDTILAEAVFLVMCVPSMNEL
jgi:hypothetical protein